MAVWGHNSNADAPVTENPCYASGISDYKLHIVMLSVNRFLYWSHGSNENYGLDDLQDGDPTSAVLWKWQIKIKLWSSWTIEKNTV